MARGTEKSDMQIEQVKHDDGSAPQRVKKAALCFAVEAFRFITCKLTPGFLQERSN